MSEGDADNSNDLTQNPEYSKAYKKDQRVLKDSKKISFRQKRRSSTDSQRRRSSLLSDVGKDPSLPSWYDPYNVDPTTVSKIFHMVF